MQKYLILCGLFLCRGAIGQDASSSTAPTDIDVFARDSYRIDSLVCPFKDRIDYEPGEIECGLLSVPENREDPDTRFIELHFVKLVSTWDDVEAEDDDDDTDLAPGRRDDPVIYLTGGPGAAAEYYVDRFKDHGIRKHRDLYILEQRGIVNSGDFCRTYAERNVGLKNVATLKESAAALRGESRACAENATAAGVDLSAYNTIENARDVRALRVALGFDQWNVWGISYGTILGQAYIKEDPDGILAIVLDAIVPLDARSEPISWRVINWYDRDLRKLDELCKADSACARRYPDLGERVRDGIRAASTQPVTVDVKDTEYYPTGKAHILSDFAGFLPFTLFYEQSNYPALPAIIDAWADAFENRDETLFRALAIAGSSGMAVGISPGMYDAIMCNDGFRDAMVESLALDRSEFPVLTNAVLPEGDTEARAEMCHDLGMIPRPGAQYAAVETDIPTLLIEGDMDPITPPPLAHVIAPGFSNATYVEFPYAGHGPSRSVECAGDMLNKFYDDPVAAPDLSCVDEMEAPEFISLYRSSFAPRMIALAMEDKEELPKVAAWGGISILGVLVGFLVLTFAPLVRRIEKREPAPADGARLAAWGAACAGTAALAILGAAAGVSYELSEVLLVLGLVGWAALGAWLGVVSGILGVVALVLTVRARRNSALPAGTLTGFVITSLAAVSLSVFLMMWGLGP